MEELVIKKKILHELGDWHVAALFTSIATESADWQHHTFEWFENDWLLTRRPFERARKALVDGGYIEVKRAGIPARSWYRLTPKGVALLKGAK